MYLEEIKIYNYKSFLESKEIKFTPGFNVIIGPNNVGKTALVEGLSLRFDHKPHRSMMTLPTRFTTQAQRSRVQASFALAPEELPDLLIERLDRFYVAKDNSVDV